MLNRKRSLNSNYGGQSQANRVRESFFDYIQGPNENRFIPFNNMPKNCSKYRFEGEKAPAFEKYISREAAAASDLGGSILSSQKKNRFL